MIAGKQVFINLIFKNRALCAVFINNGVFIFILVGDGVVVSVLFPFCGIDGIAGYGFGHLGAPAGEYIARSRGVLAESGSCAVLGKVSEGFILEYYLALHAVGVDNGVFHFRYILLPHGVKRGVLRYFKGVGGSVYNGFSLA